MCAQSLSHVQLFATPWIVPGGACGKEPTYQCRRLNMCGFSLWVGKILWRTAWQPTLVFLHPMDRIAWWAMVHSVTESNMTEATCHAHTDCSLPGFSDYGIFQARIRE